MTDIQKLKLIASAVSSKDEWYTTKTIGAFPEYENDKDFVIAANPAAVLELIADLESYQVGAKVEADAGDEARSEVRKLKAENEALRKDARRWQCVRNAIPMQSPYAVWREGSHLVLGKDADDLVDNFLSHGKEASQ